jgi:hypothetical protein
VGPVLTAIIAPSLKGLDSVRMTADVRDGNARKVRAHPGVFAFLIRPLPVFYFGHVFAVFGDVLLMVYKFVVHMLVYAG